MSTAYKPGDTVYCEFTTQVFATGVATNADSTPTGTVNRNGTDDGSVTVTVTNIDTARYKAVFAVPSTYVPGDVLTLSIAATVSSVAGKAVIGNWKLGVGFVAQGTAAAGGSTTITLQTALGADNLGRGCLMVLASGTGAGQAAVITGYVDSTKVATVDKAWTVTPDTTTVYVIVPCDVPKVDSSLQVAADAKAINGVSTSNVTAVNASVGTTQPVNFTGTGTSAYVKGDATFVGGQTANASAAVSFPAQVGTSTLTQTQVTGGAYSVQSSSCVLGDTRIAHLDADVSSRLAPSGTLATVTTLTNAPSDSSGTTTLLSRLTSARAGYLDNLNVSGSVASHADIAAINQSASKHLLLVTVGQYEPGETYTVEMRTFSAADGSAVNADTTPTLTATGNITGSLSANLSVASNPATGLYRWTYTPGSSPTLEQIRFDGSATINSATFTLSAYSQTVDFATVVFTSADQTHLTAIYNKLPTNNIADETLVLSALGTPMQAYTQPTGFLTATFPGTVASPTNITAGTITNLANAPTNGDFTSAMKNSLNAATPAVTVSDKTGFSLSAPGVQQIWDALTSALTTSGSIGKFFVTNIDAAISTRMATYVQPVGFLTSTFGGTIANTTNITSANVTVAGYASGHDPATLLLVTPANKVSTNTNGAVIVSGGSLDTVGSVSGLVASNLDAAISSVPTAAQIRTEIDTNSIGLAAIYSRTDVATSTRMSAGSQVVISGYATGMDPATQVLATPSQPIVTDASGQVTVGTIATGVVSSVWNALTSSMTTAGSIGMKFAGFVLGSDNKVVISTDSITPVNVTQYAGTGVGGVDGSGRPLVAVDSYSTGKDPATQVLASPSHPVVTDASGQVTVGTIASAAILSIWNALTTGLTVAGSIGLKLAGLVVGSDHKVIVSSDLITPTNVMQINGSSSAAIRQQLAADVIFVGSVTGSSTSTSFADTTLTGVSNDHWVGRVIIFTSGNLTKQATDISAFDVATKTLTFTATTQAPAVSDTYIII